MKYSYFVYRILLPGVMVLSLFATTPLCRANAETRTSSSEDGKISIVFPLLAPRISSKFGPRIHPIRRFSQRHQGVDLAAPENSHVRAVTGGLVVFAGNYAGFGKLVTIEHADGYASLYGHLTEILVNTGQTVAPGALIGRVGSTGSATGPHLHFEWRHKGKALDPLKVFPHLGAAADG